MTQPPDAATPVNAGPADDRSAPTPGTVAGRMAARLADAQFPRGDLAALRRMDPDHPDPPAFIVLMLACGAPDTWTVRIDNARAWALIAHAMALMAPAHHRGDAWLGNALHAAGLSEARLARLLTARGVQFRSQIRRLARYLAQRGHPVNWQQLARLILAEAHDSTGLDELRLTIARGFFSARHHSTTEPDTGMDAS